MEHVITSAAHVGVDAKTKDFWLSICQIVFMLAIAFLFAIAPSLLVWKFHILPATDPAVVAGLIGCYAFAIILIVFNVYQIKKVFAK